MEWLLLAIAILLVLACGVFVAAEFSLITVDRALVEEAAGRGDRRANTVLSALRSLSTQLSGAQLGITVTNLAIGFLAEPAIASLLVAPLTALGVPDSAVSGISLGLGLLIATAVTMVVGELVPKNLAIARPLATARTVAGFQRGFTATTAHIIRMLNGSANATVRLLGVEPTEELASARSAEELVAVVAHSAEEGTLDAETAVLVARSLAFGDRLVRDVMTPRTRVRFVHAQSPVSAVLALSRETGHSRFPVVGSRGLDDTRGVVHIKQALAVPRDLRETVTADEVTSPPLLVPDSLELDPLLDDLRESGLQMAVVMDEYGGAAGIVTLEDLVEEIVGEVVDEHDRVETRVTRLRHGEWVVSALLRLDEVEDATGLEIPSEDQYDTIAGLIADHLERVPARGDEVEIGPVVLRVLRMDGRRVDRVLISPAPQADPEEAS